MNEDRSISNTMGGRKRWGSDSSTSSGTRKRIRCMVCEFPRWCRPPVQELGHSFVCPHHLAKKWKHELEDGMDVWEGEDSRMDVDMEEPSNGLAAAQLKMSTGGERWPNSCRPTLAAFMVLSLLAPRGNAIEPRDPQMCPLRVKSG